MSGSQSKLEQILELLLSEENERAEELLHEYVVAKARAEYEKVLEADEDMELDTSEDEIEGDEEGELDMGMGDEEPGDEEDMDMDMEMDMDDETGSDEESPEDEESDEADLEDKVDDMQDELEQLRAEFEELMAQEEGEEEHADMGADMSMEMPKEGVVEATTFSKPASVQPMKGASMKGSENDSSNSKSPFSSKPKATTVVGSGAPVKSKDGGEGKHNHGGSVKDHTPTDNMDIEPKKAAAPSKSE